MTSEGNFNDLILKQRLQQASSVAANGCWLPLNEDKRAVIQVYGQTEYASRVACQIRNGAPPDVTSVARHMCTSATCINPEHLEWGTFSQNNGEDKERDGTLIRGAAHHNASITEEVARAIKHSVDDGTRWERADRYGVSEGLVGKIDTGHSWRHIPDKNGDISVNTRSNEAASRKKAKERVWTTEMFAEAARILTEKSISVVNPSMTTPCQVWQGNVDIGGYGYFRIFGKQVRVHVVAKEAQLGSHKPHKHVGRHLCSNQRACCNPDHIAFGTAKENAQDKKIQGTCFFSSDRNPKKKSAATL